MRAGTAETLAAAARTWLTAAEAGAILNRSGRKYKPSTLRGYDEALRLRLLPAFGGRKLTDIHRAEVQAFIDREVANGVEASTLRNTLMPLRAIFRRAVSRGMVAVNPTSDVELPAVTSKRERIVPPEEAARLIDALLPSDRALWSVAAYAGLRCGELQALDWVAIDLEAGVINVDRSWDRKAGFIDPKSQAGKRTVPIPSTLRSELIAHRLATGGHGLAFGRSPDAPFDPSTVTERARRVWLEAGLAPLTLHDLRHTYASFLIKAQVNAKAISAYMGHASISITFDRYGKLMPGNESEAASLLDALLEGHTGAV